ncbi:hypothetical protein B1207_14420 [Legionella quinlivanii]|uniref:Carbon storage regulator n=1 Tax=Legionella quinlivanii TaxID=45073 RepID=A0A364LFP2_9GAMM|nr:carbon storage regulator [Legionella quinlivanii]RAP34885.1 hypothetical protein B1207_14420 [Legionella quinlivanii]
MLILTRRIGESIVIAQDILITVLGMTAKQIRIGIDIPNHMAVEIQEAYCDPQRLAKLDNMSRK